MTLLKPHKILLAIAAALLLAEGALLFLVLLPAAEDLEYQREDVEANFSKLKSKSWPIDGQKLEEFLRQMEAMYDGKGNAPTINSQAQAALRKASDTFQSKILQDYGTLDDFRRGISRLDYQSEYVRISKELQERGVRLSPAVLKLTDEPATVHIYQPAMSIWTVERVVKLALEHQLTVPMETAPAQKKAPGRSDAAVTALPMRAWFETQLSPSPYLLEFPVRIVVQGTLEKCNGYLAALQNEETFLPVRAFELPALPPPMATEGEDGRLRAGPVRMTLEICSYLSPTP